MSTPLGITFAQSHGEAYGHILETWGQRLKGVPKITEELKSEWVIDLLKALEKPLLDSILDKPAPTWKKVDTFSSPDSLERFAKVAIRQSLAQDHFDLLNRLHRIAQEDIQVTSLQAAITVGTILKRVPQTVAQIFDMVVDTFNYTVRQAFQRKGSLTGRRRWHTASMKSRHRGLNQQVKEAGDNFSYEGNSVWGPRPPGGSPKHWSGCSCYLTHEKSNGDWVRI